MATQEPVKHRLPARRRLRRIVIFRVRDEDWRALEALRTDGKTVHEVARERALAGLP